MLSHGSDAEHGTQADVWIRVHSGPDPEGKGRKTEMFRQDQAEAAVYAMAKATKRWLKMVYGKDIDLAQVGRILIDHSE